MTKKERIQKRVRENVECLIQTMIMLTMMVGAWTILGAIIYFIDLPKIIGAFVGVIMLFGVPAGASWVMEHMELEI